MVGFRIAFEERNTIHNVVVLAIAQAFVGVQLPMNFILGDLARAYLSITSCFGTLPVSITIIGSTIATPFLSKLMQKIGRRIGFIIESLSSAWGASICSFALYMDHLTYLSSDP